ncbi:MAG: sugar transferase [Thermoleophilaceae bacterium]
MTAAGDSLARGDTVVAGVRTAYPVGARVVDLAVVAVLSPVLAFVAAIVAIAVALDSPGPVLFRSVRIGRDGRRFEMLKFRTMVHRCAGPSISCDGDARYTPVGRLLAAARLDELPQVWNVACGEMRLVGPRPEVEQFVRAQAGAYRQILALPPGITGPTQLAFADEGRRLALVADPERVYAEEILPVKVRLDVDYVRRRSLRRDMVAIAHTWLVPGRQLALALRDDRHARGRPVEALAGAATMVLAVVAMVAAFAAQGATTAF